jgi:autotransporter-associated beta strand protein
MKTPNTTPLTTRATLIATAAYNTRWFARLVAGSAVLSSSALATDWEGDVSGDWNDNNNWVGDAGTIGSNATINATVPNIATISADIPGNPVDIFVGTGAGTNGRLDHTAGIAATGGGNWMFVGHNGGTGTYNLADTAGTGGSFTGFGQGTGNMNVGGRLYIGGFAGTGSNGTVNVNTTGTLAIPGQLQIGTNGSTGTLNIDSGAVTTGDWTEVGNGAGCNGTLRIADGSITKTGGNHFIVASNGATGQMVQTGGALNINNDVWIGQAGGSTGTVDISAGSITNGGWSIIGRAGGNGTFNMTGGSWTKNGGGVFVVAEGNGSVGVLNQSAGDISAGSGEFWVGQAAGSTGTYNLSGGTLVTNNWVAVGRDGGTGTVNMTGGTWTKAVNGAFIIGASGPGTLDQSAGLVDVQLGDTWMGENNTCTYTLSGSGEFRANYFQVARNGASVSTVNFNGGTLRANQIVGGAGTENVSFNGTQIIARVDQANFIGGMDFGGATIDAGGLLIDSNGFNLTAPQSFDGTGGVVKSGAGSLTLSGGNSYAGDNVVNAGTLNLDAGATGTGAITLADATTLGINALFAGDQLTASAATFGSSADTTLNLGLGDVNGFNPANSILDVTGALAVNGVVTVNVAGAKFAVGEIPLLSYNAAQLSGSGSFLLGTLPSGVVATLESDPDYFGPGLAAVYLDITSVALPEWNGTNEVVLEKFADTVDASADIVVTDATGIVVGQLVRGAGIPAATTVTAISGLTITLSAPATATDTFVDLDFVVTAGTNEGLWDTTTENWVDQVTSLSSLYADPNPVLFSDNATGPTAVVLNSVVSPSEVNFNNSTLVYSLSGSGEISGTTGLLKQGSAGLTVENSNSYTGVTRLEGGTTTVATLANGGVNSPLGAATSDPANLVLAGGTLEYTGGAISFDRGLSLQGASGLIHANDLTLTGPLARTAGGITKTGAGLLTLSNAANAIGTFRVNEGNLAFDGSGGPQVNNANGFFMGAGVNVSLPNDTVLNSGGDVNVGDVAGAVSTLTLSGNAVFNSPNRVLAGVNSAAATGDIMVSGDAEFNILGGWFSAGQTGTGNLTVKDNGRFYQATSDFNISDLANSVGNFNLQDAGEADVNFGWFAKNPGTTANVNISGGTFNTRAGFMAGGLASDAVPSTGLGAVANINQTGGAVTFNSDDNRIGANATAVWNISGGSILSNGWMTLGRYVGGSGTMNASGGTVTQNHPDRPFRVGENGSGVLNVSGTAEVTAANAGGFSLGGGAGSSGEINLDGGTLVANRIYAGGVDGNSALSFDGGTLRAAAGANPDWIPAVLDLASVDAGGAFIDTNGQTVAISQVLDDGGGDLTKQGAGTLRLNGANSYFGTTTVEAGELGGTGSLTGPLVVDAGATVNPGVTAGTFTVGDATTINGTYVCEIDGANADNLAVFGPLTIGNGAVLDFNELSAPTAIVYIIASYGSLSGSFTVQDLPAGYTLDTNYQGGNQIALVKTLSVYEAWAASFGLDPFTDGASGFDKDGDGQSNGLEFALGGSPVSGSDNAKVYQLRGDTADAGTDEELLLTIAVRSGTPAFAGSPSPTATHDGVTYTIEGSLDLADFTSAVTPVAAVTTGLPAAPAGYEYRTFSLDASDGLPSKGFLRVDVTP